MPPVLVSQGMAGDLYGSDASIHTVLVEEPTLAVESSSLDVSDIQNIDNA